MQNIGSFFIVLGIATLFLVQIIGTILVLRSNLFKGILSLAIPGYFIFSLRREGLYTEVIGTWFLGVICIVVGTIVLS